MSHGMKEDGMKEDGMKDLRPRGIVGQCMAAIGDAVRHLRREGLAVAFAYCAHRVRAKCPSWQRDAGERAAERYLKTLGYRILARNWRSPRDRRDEADLIALSPDRSEAVIVEVKRASGPWDALERVDSRKKEVLWRLLLDLESVSQSRRGGGGFARSLSRTRSIRVDLVAIRGTGRTATMVRHETGIFERRSSSRDPPRAHAVPLAHRQER